MDFKDRRHAGRALAAALAGWRGRPGLIVLGLPRGRLVVQTRFGEETGWRANVEAQAVSAVPVANVSAERAAGYGVVDASVGYGFARGSLVGRAFLAVDNVFDRRYAGSVIVNEGNQRYFEPAPGRTWLVGASAGFTF